MEKKYDVTALGELLVDFTQNGESGQGNPLFEANPGGAPCNVLAMLTKLGRRTAFLGKVGDDMFGRFLRERAKAQGIDLTGLCTDPEIPTTLAFVQTFADGDRDFSFYRKPGADMRLTVADVRAHEDLIQGSRVFHFGTLSQTDPEVAEATEAAVRIAKEAGAVVSFDPNYRAPLWRSEEEAKDRMRFGLEQCDVLKISDNEIVFLTGETDLEKGLRDLVEKYQIPLAFATMGKEGSIALKNGKIVRQAGFLNPDTIETTGAGDTFMACALEGVLTHGVAGCDETTLPTVLRFANAAASLITTRRGALSVMPDRVEVQEFLRKVGTP